MLSSLLLKYFKNLTKKDRRELSKFVRSPFHNQRAEVIRLFDYLNEHFDNPSPSDSGSRTVKTGIAHPFKKEIVYSAIYPNKQDFNDALLRATMSQLTDLIKAYFVHSELKYNNKYINEKTYIFRQSLIERGYKEEYEQQLVFDFNHSVVNGQRQDTYNRYVILSEKMFWQAKYNRSESLFLNELSETLDAGYVIELLRIACTMQSHKAITVIDYNLELLETVLERLETGWLSEHLYVQVFYHAYWAMQYKAENYHKLDKILRETAHIFDMTDLHFLYEVALSYNVHCLNFKDMAATTDLWWYSKTGFERKILIQNNLISPHHVISIVSLGLSRFINDVEWVDSFMNEYKKYLPPINREDYILLIEGVYHFYKKNYNESISLLKKISFKDEYHQLRSRRMLAVMYFELAKLDLLVSHLESFKVYLYRLKTVAYQKDANLHFIRFFEKLLKINLSNRQECLALWTQIEQVACVAMEDWFREKLV